MMEPGFYCMDCMEAMREFPDGFFDLAVVDPPYGDGGQNIGGGGGTVCRKQLQKLQNGTASASASIGTSTIQPRIIRGGVWRTSRAVQ